MEETVSVWDEIGILRQVVAHKLLFVETPDSVESSLALSNYRFPLLFRHPCWASPSYNRNFQESL